MWQTQLPGLAVTPCSSYSRCHYLKQFSGDDVHAASTSSDKVSLTFGLSPMIRSVAMRNLLNKPVKAKDMRFHWSVPLVSCSDWSDCCTASKSVFWALLDQNLTGLIGGSVMSSGHTLLFLSKVTPIGVWWQSCPNTEWYIPVVCSILFTYHWRA